MGRCQFGGENAEVLVDFVHRRRGGDVKSIGVRDGNLKIPVCVDASRIDVHTSHAPQLIILAGTRPCEHIIDNLADNMFVGHILEALVDSRLND